MVPSIQTPRPEQYLQAVNQHYPNFSRTVRSVMEVRDLKPWQAWCYLPVAGAYAIASDGQQKRSLAVADRMALLSAIIAWRTCKGIYRFDPSVATALLSSPPPDAIPWDVFTRLPEWCPYVEAPVALREQGLAGFWVHLDDDQNTGVNEVRLTLDMTTSNPASASCPVVPLLFPRPVMTFDQLAESLMKSAIANMQSYGDELVGAAPDQRGLATWMRHILWPMLSLTLYLCSADNEIVHPKDGPVDQPRRPLPQKTKMGYHIDCPGGSEIYETAFRLGRVIRSSGSGTPDRGAVRPHIRRAHWHAYWVGPRDSDDRRQVLKWLPPIPVNIDDEEGPSVPTVRHVDE